MTGEDEVGGSDERVNVFVELDMSTPTDECLERLRGLGLEVETTLGSKVLGSASESVIAALEGDPDVRAVERSRKMRKHGR